MRTMLASPLARTLFHKTIVQSAGGIGAGLPEGTLSDDERIGKMLVESIGWKPEELLSRSGEEVYFNLLDAAYKHGYPMVFRPTVDGYLLTQTTENSINKGELAPVPILCGAVAGDSESKLKKYEGNSDFEMIKSMIAAVETISWGHVYGKNQWNPVYSYYFDRQLPGDAWGATSFHSGELWYVFGTLYRGWRSFTGYDYELSSYRAVRYQKQHLRERFSG